MYSRWKLQRRPVPPSSAPPFVLLVPVIFTHRAIHSRLTTGGVTVSPLVPPRPLPPSLSVFFVFSVSFLAPFPFARCRFSRLAALVEERWSFLSRASAERAGGLKVGHFGFSKSWSRMTGNFLSPSSSRPRAREASERRAERRRGSGVDIISTDKKSRNYSMSGPFNAGIECGTRAEIRFSRQLNISSR